MITSRALLLLSLFGAGCASESQTYIARHPELSAAHRQILATGKIPGGAAVAGLTREQVTLVMHGNPDTFDRIDGEEAWIYKRKQVAATEFTGIEGPGQSGSLGSRNTESLSTFDNTGPQTDVSVKTTIIFHGDRAVRAETVVEKQ